MKTKKTNYLIFTIVIILLITILFSIFLIKSNTGNATKIMDSKQSFETTTINNTLSSQKLTEFNIPTKEQLDTTSISQTFKENTEIDLKLDKPINAFSVTGNATLLSEAGLVRIILVDSEEHEYLVYEISSLLAENSKDTKFENICEETCVLDKPITAVSMKIQVEDAVLDIFSINTLPEDKQFTEIKDIKSYKQEILKSQNQAKIEKYNSAQSSWKAGETSVSNLSYEEQKRLFTKEDGTIPEYLPNLQGFLYYKGGIFTLKESSTSSNSRNTNNTTIQPPINPPTAEPNYILPDSWDWRNVHGENWNSPIKDQGFAGTCMYFTAIGTLESRINLYYNQHLDLNLSEQMIVDCSMQPYPNSNYNFNNCNSSTHYHDCKIINEGVADELCDIYVERDVNPVNCTNTNVCNNWIERSWLNSNVNSYYEQWSGTEMVFSLNETAIKEKIIKYGPLYSEVLPLGHAMVLIGYNKTSWNIIGSPTLVPLQICINSEYHWADCNDENETRVVSYNANVKNNSIYNTNIFYITTLPGIKTLRCQSTNINDPNYFTWVDFNDEPCPENTISVNGMCVYQSLYPGFTTCDKSLKYILEYNPNIQDIWIFKNSWGTNWGDNGFLYISPQDMEFQSIVVLNGIVTPPTDTSYWPADFNNTINCEDRDGDHYCNWGISEQKPSTCPSFCNAEKDCDDSNPDLLGFVSETNLNCRYKYEIEQ